MEVEIGDFSKKFGLLVKTFFMLDLISGGMKIRTNFLFLIAKYRKMSAKGKRRQADRRNK